MSLSFKEQWKKNFSKSDARCFEEEQILLLFAVSAVRLFVASKGSIYIHVLAENCVFLPIWNTWTREKCRRIAILARIFCHARHEFGYQGRELDLCDGDGQRGDGAEVSNHSCNRITRSILSSYPPRFFALATFWSSFLLQALLSGTFLSKWPDPTPKFTKRSDRRRIRFCSYSFLFHLVFSTSFLNRIQTAESSGWLQSNFMFFLLWNFYSCRVTLHYSPACGLYYVFVLLQRPVSIYTKRIFRGVSSHLGTQLRQFEQLVKISFAIWLYRNFTFHVCFFSEQRDCFLFFFCNNNFFFLMTSWQVWKMHPLSENSFDFLPLSLIPTIVKIHC